MSELLSSREHVEIVGLLIAALGGAAVGLERQWSGHTGGPAARFAGIRTFTMLGAVGGVSGWLWMAGAATPAAILLAGAVAVVAADYVAGSRHDIDGTTEVAALVVLAAGLLGGCTFPSSPVQVPTILPFHFAIVQVQSPEANMTL